MKTNKYPIIAIEGIDGAGKTTVAQKLAEELNGIYYRTPPSDYSECRKLFEVPERKGLPRFFFYLGSLWEAWSEIEKCAKHKYVVLDRYLLSTKIYHQILLENSKKELDILCRAWDFIVPPSADFNILLNVSEPIAHRRLENLNKEAFDKALEQNRSFQNKVKQEFISSANSIVDVDNKSVNEIVKEILRIIS